MRILDASRKVVCISTLVLQRNLSEYTTRASISTTVITKRHPNPRNKIELNNKLKPKKECVINPESILYRYHHHHLRIISSHRTRPNSQVPCMQPSPCPQCTHEHHHKHTDHEHRHSCQNRKNSKSGDNTPFGPLPESHLCLYLPVISFFLPLTIVVLRVGKFPLLILPFSQLLNHQEH